MQVLINHLTRMQPGWICSAGNDLESGRLIRPVAHSPLMRNLLQSEGGPLALGQVVDLGVTEFCGQVPEIEDRRFEIANLKAVRLADYDELYQACQSQAKSRLRDIFGNDLQWINHSSQHPGTAAVEQYGGIRSLGFYWASVAQLKVAESQAGRRLRMHFNEGDLQYSVPVTDHRLFQADHVTPADAAISQLNEAIKEAPAVLVAVGLSRPFSYNEDLPRHWLQVNNIYPGV